MAVRQFEEATGRNYTDASLLVGRYKFVGLLVPQNGVIEIPKFQTHVKEGTSKGTAAFDNLLQEE